MLRRYYRTTMGGQTTFFYSNTQETSTGSTGNFLVVIKGPPGANVVLEVTTFSAASGDALLYMYQGSPDGITYGLNSIFPSGSASLTIGSDGSVSFYMTLYTGSESTGYGINVTVTIISTSKGRIGSKNTQGQLWTY